MKKELFKAGLLRTGSTTFRKGVVHDFTEAQFRNLKKSERELFRDYEPPEVKVTETEKVQTLTKPPYNPETDVPTDANTVAEIRAHLDFKEINYDDNLKKADLLALLEDNQG